MALVTSHNSRRSGHRDIAPSPAPTVHAFTVDVEDYFQVTAFERSIPREQWPQFPSRVAANTHRLLNLLEQANVKATFFILGWVAERQKQLVEEIHAAGHEIGSHSYWHRLVYHLSPAEFREDLRRSRGILQDLTGQPVDLYRAPTFSVTKHSLWALEILADEGVRVDSSISPSRYARCGIADAAVAPHVRTTPSGPLYEFPAAVFEGVGLRCPIGGGGYFRFFPYRVTQMALSRIAQAQPFMFYIHPWELDPEQPRCLTGSRSSRFRHYVNLSKTEARLERLLKTFSFAPISAVLDGYFGGCEPRHSPVHLPPRRAVQLAGSQERIA